MPKNSQKKLILASRSPRRRELLGWLGIPFEIHSLDIPEESQCSEAWQVAEDIAKQKGQAVWKDWQLRAGEMFLISSDTIVVLDGKIYGKPKDREDAKNILNELSGRTHEVITGVYFCFQNQNEKIVEKSFHVSTDVTFRAIDHWLLESYLNTGDSLDKAGAYGIQGPSLTFIEKLNGSYSNVVGFPLDQVIMEMKKLLGENFHERFAK